MDLKNQIQLEQVLEHNMQINIAGVVVHKNPFHRLRALWGP
jgi:hypothetical protein